MAKMIREPDIIGIKRSLGYGSVAKMIREPGTVDMERLVVYGLTAKSYNDLDGLWAPSHNGRTGYEPQVTMVGRVMSPKL